MRWTTALAIVLVAFLCADLKAAPNLIVNGSFESTFDAGGGTQLPTGWTLRAGSAGVYADPGNAVDGANYMQGGQYLEMGQITSHVLAAGEVLNFSAYGRSFGTPDFYDVRLYANSNPGGGDISGGNVIATLQMDPNASAMTGYNTQFAVNPTDAGKTLAVYIATSPGWKGFDAISVTVPEPSALTLAGIGATLLLHRRRRVV